MEEILRPAQITILKPSAPGTKTASNSEVTVDYSNTADGYVMVKYLTDPGVRIKVQLTGSSVTYTYNITPGEWTVFPLSDGNGSYTVKVFRNVIDNRYTTVLSTSFNVSMKNEFAPFLRPNQYVNYENMPLTAKLASSVTHDGASMLEKVKAIYNYVVTNISYDYAKAASVQSGYLPDLDQVISSKKGICFDYAALMTGMLRVLNIPCKLVVGYAGSEYHAWISVWSQETGWIDGAIYFNGTNWQRMDPTFAASGSADSINKISYTSKYVY
jgi:transglutaminase-like putative cysteine protease